MTRLTTSTKVEISRMDTVRSKNNVSVRLPEARWFHITEEHSEMAGYYFEVLETVEDPDIIYQGNDDECLALKEIKKDKYIVVVYKEVSKTDGFIITAFLTKRKKQFDRKQKLWPL
jgi:hypothetical protein